jgi:predicted DNA binding CopG/RHH family protein
MAGKKINFGSKPSQEKTVDVEKWVADRAALIEASPKNEPKLEKMKRLTIDLPESLHKSIKLKATTEGVTMAELLRQLLEEHYGREV